MRQMKRISRERGEREREEKERERKIDFFPSSRPREESEESVSRHARSRPLGLALVAMAVAPSLSETHYSLLTSEAEQTLPSRQSSTLIL